jgi:Smg protein
MKENVFDVLMYLFENYYMDDDGDPGPDRESVQIELMNAGFPTTEVKKAFEWLDGLSHQHNDRLPAPQTGRSIRLYSGLEMERLDMECRGFLMFLEQAGILSADSRELVIDRVMALDTEELDLNQLKWVILMVLFNQPGQEAAYAWMEDLLFENATDSLH